MSRLTAKFSYYTSSNDDDDSPCRMPSEKDDDDHPRKDCRLIDSLCTIIIFSVRVVNSAI